MSLFEELKKLEGSDNSIYGDSKGIPTIGIGYNLRVDNVLRAVLDAFGYNATSLTNANFGALVGELEKIFDKTWDTSNTETLTKEVNDKLKEYRDKVTDNAGLQEKFEFDSSTTDMKDVFDAISGTYTEYVTDGFQNNLSLTEKKAQELFNSLSHAQQASLTSLAYNGGTALIGPRLSKAIQNKDWAEVYFQIAYDSNLNRVKVDGVEQKIRIYGLHNRRLEEVESFISDLSKEDKKKLYEKLIDKKDEITEYLDELQSSLSNGGFQDLSKTKRDELYKDLNDFVADFKKELADENITVESLTFKSSLDENGGSTGGSNQNNTDDQSTRAAA